MGIVNLRHNSIGVSVKSGMFAWQDETRNHFRRPALKIITSKEIFMTQSKPNLPLNATRRNILIGGSALAVSAFAQFPGKAFAATIDADGFLELSKKLTGHSGLSADDAMKMLQAFKTIGKDDELAALAAGDANPELGNEIVASWYSGLSPDPDSEEVITYTEALMWPAMSYTKPMGYCGGGTGYWADPPES